MRLSAQLALIATVRHSLVESWAGVDRDRDGACAARTGELDVERLGRCLADADVERDVEHSHRFGEHVRRAGPVGGVAIFQGDRDIAGVARD
jgi:hypothetical protein